MATLQVVLDTNVLLSGIAYPTSVPGKIIAAWHYGSIDVLLSVYILEGLRRVLPRLVHRHNLTAAEIDDLVDILSIQAEVIEPLPRIEPDLRDDNDRPALGALLTAIIANLQNNPRESRHSREDGNSELNVLDSRLRGNDG